MPFYTKKQKLPPNRQIMIFCHSVYANTPLCSISYSGTDMTEFSLEKCGISFSSVYGTFIRQNVKNAIFFKKIAFSP